MKKKLVYLCDWLPPDFGAVGQYALQSAREWANDGWQVTLVGLTSDRSRCDTEEPVGKGTVTVVRVHRSKYRKENYFLRVYWTIFSNVLLLMASFKTLRRADAVLFTGSPPLMLHFIVPLNVILKKQLIYRITDFYPECLIAERGRSSRLLDLLLRLTMIWRRRIDIFEVLGIDQAGRLTDMGIAKERICLKRNPSPIVFTPDVIPFPPPQELRTGSGIILYSGNWGVAHDEATFVDGYKRYRLESEHGFTFWLNATGVKADRVEGALRSSGLPIYRSHLFPLELLSRILLSVDVHLITLRDSFVGYVLPSKVHACIESRKRILFIGSGRSDVHLLASQALPPDKYCQVNVGDAGGVVNALHAMERAVLTERRRSVFEGISTMPAAIENA